MTDKNLYGEAPEFFNSSDNFTSSASANDMATANTPQNLTYYQECNLRVSKRKTVIAVDDTILDKIKGKCQIIQESKFPFEEIFLSVASLLFGVALNALFAGIKFEESALSIFSYVISPMIAVGCGVTYFFLKKVKANDAKQIAKEILEYIADIEEQCDSIEDVTANV